MGKRADEGGKAPREAANSPAGLAARVARIGKALLPIGNESPASGTAPMPMPNQQARRLWMASSSRLATGLALRDLVKTSLAEAAALVADRDPNGERATRPLDPETFGLLVVGLVDAFRGLRALGPDWTPTRQERNAAWDAFVYAFDLMDEAE